MSDLLALPWCKCAAATRLEVSERAQKSSGAASANQHKPSRRTPLATQVCGFSWKAKPRLRLPSRRVLSDGSRSFIAPSSPWSEKYQGEVARLLQRAGMLPLGENALARSPMDYGNVSTWG